MACCLRNSCSAAELSRLVKKELYLLYSSSLPELHRLAIADCSIIPFAAASVNMSNLPITQKSKPHGGKDDNTREIVDV